MFKGKLIENDNYYKLRSKQLLLFLLPSILIGFIANFYLLPIWVTIVLIGLYILLFILLIRNQKQVDLISGNKLIEIDEREIRIKTKKGGIEETINLEEVEKIVLKGDYSIPQETMKEIGEELIGKTKQNYIILQQNNESRKLDFEIGSYFMINQLKKIILNWETRGYEIERINRK